MKLSIGLLLTIFATPLWANDFEHIKYMCLTESSAKQVAVNSVIPNTEMILGITPLPSDCSWTLNLFANPQQYIDIFKLPDDRYAIITPLDIDGITFYTAGIIDLTS